MTSALQGVIEKLERGERLSADAIDELRRVLRLLQGEGWSGFITADDALRAIIRATGSGKGQTWSDEPAGPDQGPVAIR